MATNQQAIFVPCHECREFITHDLTNESRGMEFIPLQLFEGDSYLNWNFDMFGLDTWTCFPCSETRFDEFVENPNDPIHSCDFVHGFGRYDCKGCDKCAQWDWNYFFNSIHR